MKRRVNNRVSAKEQAMMRCTRQVKTTLAHLIRKGSRLPTHLLRRIWMWTGQKVVQMKTQTARRTLRTLILLLDSSLALMALGSSFFPSCGRSMTLTQLLKENILTPYRRDTRSPMTSPSVYPLSLKSTITKVLMTSGCMRKCSMQNLDLMVFRPLKNTIGLT